MKHYKHFVCLSSLLLLFTLPGEVWSQQHWDSRGSSWGEIRYPASPEEVEKDDLILEGAVTQNFASYELSPRTNIDYFVKLGFTFDSERIDYNNKITLGPGIKIRRSFSLQGIISAGAIYEIEHRPIDDQNYSGLVLFTQWYNAWTAPCSFCTGQDYSPMRLPGRTWGNLQYPAALTVEEEDDLLLEGAIEQGIDWLETDFGVLNSFVDLAYKADSEKIDWNNYLKVALGVKLTNKVNENTSLNIGVKLTKERRWVGNTTWNDVVFFVTWDAYWNRLY